MIVDFAQKIAELETKLGAYISALSGRPVHTIEGTLKHESRARSAVNRDDVTA